jgi:quinol monooxygenase YgiN
MAKFVEMDEQVMLSKQMKDDVGGSVILINKFTVNAEDVDKFLKAWTDDATIFKQQPGFISTQLHRGISGSGTFINYAVWESVAAYKKATSNVGIQTRLSNYPASTVASPHLFEKLAVPDICIEYHINDKYPKLMTRWYKSEM